MRIDTSELDGLAGPHIIFEGVNLHLRNGLEATRSINGSGNLIIGYNEPQTREGYEQMEGDRAGSHNLVVGDKHKYTNFVGLIHGYENTVRDRYGATVAGHMNDVVEGYSAAVAGHYNVITGPEGAVLGGEYNTAGRLASILGGSYNSASGRNSTIGGGTSNSATGENSSVSGGVEVMSVNPGSWAAGTLSE